MSKPDGHPWWPALLHAPTFAAIAVAAWGQGEASAYIRADPCITGRDVPWTVPFTVGSPPAHGRAGQARCRSSW
jgi:hypothetical protein